MHYQRLSREEKSWFLNPSGSMNRFLIFLFINGNMKHVSDSHLEEKQKKESRRGEEKGRNEKYHERIAAVEKSNREKLDNST
jgi:hypothetical protein